MLIKHFFCILQDLTQELYKFLSTKCVNEKTEEAKPKCYILGIDLDPILIARAVEANRYPSAIKYECVDYMSEDINSITMFLSSFQRQIFDVIFCFSVTMWIHINHGDSGLKNFLKKMSQQTKMLVIEPQPWKCYRTAVRRMKRSGGEGFNHFSDLKLRENVTMEIENIICSECNFVKVKETESTEWGRKLLFFRRL